MFTYLTLVQLLNPLPGTHTFYGCEKVGKVILFLDNQECHGDYQYLVQFNCNSNGKATDQHVLVCPQQMERVSK
jgi:hypothetical protein